ncbi:RNA polymerase [Ralstonia phage RS-PII-1]|uniref:DNA-directed RNA polymerase n=1 Tax=Ralstonia phage RS-PII-1 TaxID=1932892 RepID=A0A1L7DQC4_9CAUD|nr:RNA polymerase [Ralstonia phage RS-PII-1]APU00310.1 RNA polymerase [Ralstonia phage RS-PII-1]
MSEAQALTQAEHEARCADAGYLRALNMMKRNEESGRVENNPYMNPVLRRWLVPLTEALEAELASTGKPGRRGAHVALLRPLDPQTVAFYAIRMMLTTAITKGCVMARDAGRMIGKVLYEEVVLATFEHLKPELFWKVSHDLDRRRSKDLKHRYNALRHEANAAEVDVPAWSGEDREQIGLCLVELMRVLGMVDVTLERVVKGGKPQTEYVMYLNADLARLVSETRESVAMAMPLFQPCVEPPIDWTALNRGGFHTARLQRHLPTCVNLARSNREARRLVAQADLSKVMRGINALQRVRWQVNPDMVAAIREIGTRMNLDEIVAQEIEDKPEPPEWLTGDMTKEQMTPEQVEKFKEWKQAMRGWYERRKLNGVKWGRMVGAMGMASRFGPEHGYKPIHFVYQADFRGRLYAMTNGISPQGSDLQKSLLRFYDGKPLGTPDAVKWFKVGGASKFGYDKDTFEGRVAWIDARREQIIECAKFPTNGGLWLEADKPLQFLAWCIEYARWQEQGDAFVSHLPIGFDGSCNGLQHFSAMLRDPVGGKAVNLVDGDKPNDIYAQVAGVTLERLTGLNPEGLTDKERKYREAWLAHGINRKLVKRSVMTLPYGSTRYSCADFIVDDYLRHGLVPALDPTEYRDAATFLSHHVWESIGKVVVAARSAMDWLQKCSSIVLKDAGSQIAWTSPSGFPVIQVYDAVEVTQVRSLLMGGTVKIKIGRHGDEPDSNKHKNGIAPNFVHSMDAAHLVLTTIACEEAGIDSLAMIHDDYGTHAADAQRLYELIRETFVRMYEQHDPINDFASRFAGLPVPPQTGPLGIRSVLESRFFFA